jgi:hypothetical protein
VDWIVGASLIAVGSASTYILTHVIHRREMARQEKRQRAELAAVIGEMLQSIGAALDRIRQ